MKRLAVLPSKSNFEGLRAGLSAGTVFVTVELLTRIAFGIKTVPELLQDRLVQLLPGPVFAFILTNLLYLGKPAFFASLLLLQVALGGLGGIITARWRRPLELSLLVWLASGLVLMPLANRGIFDRSAGFALVSLAAYLAYAATLYMLWNEKTAGEDPAQTRTAKVVRLVTRREFVGGAVFLAVGAYLARTVIGTLPKLPPKGLPSPITAVKDFYIVSKNISDPHVASETWNLRVDGMTNNALNLSYSDILAMPPMQFVRTMECISNEVGGYLISTGEFTGVRMSDVLAKAGVKAGAQVLHFTSVDGYTENMTLDKAMDPDTFLVYKLNGEPLPVKHGYPLRVLGAGTYGMKNPKWLTHIELAPSASEGFWEHQGWTNDSVIKTMSRIDEPDGDGPFAPMLTFQGIAFGGDRGISKVEISLDNGRSWNPAELQPPQGPLTWVFWRQPAQLDPGSYDVLVRATDGTSTVQTAQEADSFPDGASGYDHIQIQVTNNQKT